MSRGGRRSNPGGRPPKAIEDRATFKGKVAIRISVEAAAQLQQLMLRRVEGVRTPEDMVEYLIEQETRRPAEQEEGTMPINSQDVGDRKKVREVLERYPADADVWQADSGALLVNEEPDTDDWRRIGTVAEYLADIAAA